MRQHRKANCRLKDVYEKLLQPFQVKRSTDSQKFNLVCSQIALYLESYSDALCTVYHMSRGEPRRRALNNKDQLRGVFQGKSRDKVAYQGDVNIKTLGCVTVQIHRFTITRKKEEVCSDVPVLTVWIPKKLSQDWLVQNQGGHEIGS